MSILYLVGLGPGNPSALTLEALEALQSADRILVRTRNHPTVTYLDQQGFQYESFDSLYKEAETLEEVYTSICDQVLERAQRERVAYAVPGHPLFAEKASQLLLEQAPQRGLEVRIVPAESFVDACLTALKRPLDPALQILNAWTISQHPPHPEKPALIYQIDSREIASQVKITLLDYYSSDHQITLVDSAGVPGRERISQWPLHRLDRADFTPLSSLYVPPEPMGSRPPLFEDLVKIVAILRGPQGCPWDREQTHESIRRHLLEEAYEVLEAIDRRDSAQLCEELGDLLLQVVLHSQMATEEGAFTLQDVIAEISSKLIRRHPHVFGEIRLQTSEEVLKQWEEIKASEKGGRPFSSVMEGIPKDLPALMKALEVSKRAVRVGFEWERLEDVWNKLYEELEELHQSLRQGEITSVRDEIGDLLFTLVNIARWLKVDPEEALRLMVDRFIRRFQYMERKLAQQGREISSLSLAEMDTLWEEAKSALGSEST